MSTSFSERITKIRSGLGISLDQMAKEMGVPAPTLKGVIYGEKTPKADLIEKLVSVWPQYALWLISGEKEYLAGQHEPLYEGASNAAFQIIESVDARNMDQIIVNSKHIKEAIFVQSVADDFFLDIAGDRVVIDPSEQVNRKFNFSENKRKSFVFGVSQSFGTAILLILDAREKRGFPRAILVKDDSFDLKESISSGEKSNTFLSVQDWFKNAGINKFDIGTVHYKTLRILECESDELKLSDIYPSADEDAIKSLIEWKKSFK